MKSSDSIWGSETPATMGVVNQETVPPTGFEHGLTIEYVMLSVTVVSNKESAGQFDDSIAHLIEKHLPEYHGVTRVDAQVLYKHTKIEHHVDRCECGVCQPQISVGDNSSAVRATAKEGEKIL